jgi:ribonuclease M5
MITLNIPVIVEGKYDKIKIKSIVNAVVIATDGFGVFNNAEKRALIRRLGANGVVILSDSDGGGRVIRSHLRGMLGGIPVYDLYTPQIEGKERRKAAPSKAGYLGVEGVSAEILRGIFEKFAAAHPEFVIQEPEFCNSENTAAAERSGITSAQMYELGLTGRDNSASLRDDVCRRLGLPAGMSAKAFAEAVGLLAGYEEVRAIIEEDGK